MVWGCQCWLSEQRADKPDEPSSTSGTHLVEVEVGVPQNVLGPSLEDCSMLMPIPPPQNK